MEKLTDFFANGTLIAPERKQVCAMIAACLRGAGDFSVLMRHVLQCIAVL